jgi:cellulose synthase/poly-beta-1,6-N-acetylglucosamine synthase-like glycosyltransferase
VYDADHHPDPDGFRRAWRWLSNGWDVVQGHCFIRNGEESWVARLVAVEFESIYAVSHPGRARMHDFGIFGGSNGFWRTNVLRHIRMRGSMLTEDIDSALRAVESGLRIGSDPYLVSRELAPTTLKALTNQRLRWAQGWFQVSLRHMIVALRSRRLTPRQKFGFVHLLAWRELYPILSLQMFPIVLFWLYGPAPRDVNWLVPIFVLTSLFTLSVGPWQTLFAYLRAEPDIRRRGSWFVSYLVVSSVFYTPFKNLLAVIAQLKEVRRERAWKVTPRSTKGTDQ